ncbi:Ankyrin repeat domain-containing protein 2 [Hondaea fermentalgiana]|uniref:Ankyrin repeat domain-containing protein 2 n=1 Tax=Hondaea fermentalgiana TaxID=2315210 RepID=A0A2R5GU67_9STRA|nr:Ankyrin repeat domain-containing protein 2 [Hondaea fermentalgiana]|eukprot:GBG31931.1 Ankyrin repeat domain-containing protein 2 [Hondaea fermentalgiana]
MSPSCATSQDHLQEEDADQNRSVEQFMTAMRAAVRCGDVEGAAQILLEATSALCGPETDDGALSGKLSALDKDGVTLLHVAAERGDLEMLKLLHVKGQAPVSAKDARGGEPVLEAAAAGRLECIKWLVDTQGVDVNTADDRGDTVLHLASGFGHIEVMRWLLDHGAQVDPRTKIDVTPLLYATAKGRIEAVRLLLHHGADVKARDAERGWNAAHTAAGCNQAAMLKFLINSYPALLVSKTVDGVSLAEVARREKCPDTFLAIIHFNKESEKEARRQQAEAARKKQAQDERLAKELAQRDFERLARDLQLLQKADKRHPATGTSPDATQRNARSITGASESMKGHGSSKAKNKKKKKRTPAKTRNAKKQSDVTSDEIATQSASAGNQEMEKIEEQEERNPETKSAESDVEPAGSMVFMESLQTMGVIGRPSHTELDDALDADEAAFIAGETWQVKLSKRDKKLLKKLRDHRSVRSGSEDSLSLSTSESGSEESSPNPVQDLDAQTHDTDVVVVAAHEPRSAQSQRHDQADQVKKALAQASSREPTTMALAELQNAQPTQTSQQHLPQPRTPRKGPGVPLSPVKRKNSCESRWTLGNPLKISTDDGESAGAAIALSTNPAITAGSENGNSACAHGGGPPVSTSATGVASSPTSEVGSETSARGSLDGKNVESRLRPHAPPWSPRRRKWTSPAANAGQVKAKLLMDDPPEVVENEFQRMLKRFVHMDTGARRTAKRKFAKATAEYEEKRLADAEQMETAWRNSIRSRLEKGIPLLQFRTLSLALAEIDAAEEARRMDNEIQHTILSEDQELALLVERTKATLARKDEIPLAAYAQDWRSGKLLRIPQDAVVDINDFALGLRHSVEAWRMQDKVLRVWIRFGGDELARAAKAREIGFDFDHARPGMLLMSCCVASSSAPSITSASAAPNEPKSAPLVLISAPMETESAGVAVTKSDVGDEAIRVLLIPSGSGRADEVTFALPSQRLHTGENPLHAAEVLAQELSGMAFSLTAHTVASGDIFVGTIHRDAESEHAFADTALAGAKWFALKEAKQTLDSAEEEGILMEALHKCASSAFKSEQST